MRHFLALFTAVVLPAMTLCAADIGPRHREKEGGFSYCPPKDWTVQVFPGLKYSIVSGPVAKKFAPNINFVDETAAVSLSAYVKANVETLSKHFKGFKQVSQAEFKTASGLNGVKLVTQAEQNATKLRQTFIFFSGKGDKKFVISCTALAEGGEKWDAAFEASLKSFEVD